ncbi:MAG: UDP-N-acetylmuramoyl-L-alanyl-D-glutamate--2,6-diaminopimelate ligase [Deltaproteobacteria bacterium]|nr:UDP-N-acetylmuramoyl-L-alanyl-D-glutamate--2,6-diaminopimelate ligase [Deltaproteobacteria bacterium]
MIMLRDLFTGIDATIIGPDVEVTALACDSRQISEGACFAALNGALRDGHEFIFDAIERGAKSIICERVITDKNITNIIVKDSRLALALAARRLFADPAHLLKMVGITGTSGKTTTSYLIQSILHEANLIPGLIGTNGYRYKEHESTTGLTTPESIDVIKLLRQMLDVGTRSVVMEVSSHSLCQHRVAGIDYDVAAFLNLSHEHLDYHHTLEDYFEAKAILFRQRLKSNGIAVLNYDDKYAKKLVNEPGLQVISFSLNGDTTANIRLLNAKLANNQSELEVITPRGTLQIISPLIGSFNIENILAAVSIAEALGLAPSAIIKGIVKLGVVPGRLEKVNQSGQPLVLIDYAHKPDALAKALKVTRNITSGRLICVFGCGGDRDATKRPIMGQIAAELADWIIVTNDNPRSEDPLEIASAIEQGLRAANANIAETPDKRGYVIELDRSQAIRRAITAANLNDTVLIAGKGHETYQILPQGTRHFDDREEARAVLQKTAC